MKLNDFIAGLEILKSHFKDCGDGYHIGSEHDQFYVYATETPLEPHEVLALVGLGWFQPDCDFEGPQSYQPTEGWSAWT